MTTTAHPSHDGQLARPSGPPLSRLQVLRRFSRHLLALALPLNGLTFVLTGPHPHWLPPLFLAPVLLGVVLDRRSRPERSEPAENLPDWPFDALLLVLVAIQLVTVILFARMFETQTLWSLDALFGHLVVGSSSAYSGIVVAHELIHRRNPAMRQLGRLVLSTVLYEHFYTEHVRGHHVRVGTPEDPATARYGEPFWAFYRRTVPAQFKSAWRLETARLGDPDMRWYDPRLLRSRVVHGLAFEWGLALTLALAFGPAAFVVHVAQALWATRSLEVVNYFEHWGLSRTGKRVLPQHSWDTDAHFTYYALTGLSRHADHHAFASRPYQKLRLWEQSPKLPRGYLAMFPLVMFRNRRYQELMSAELRRRGLGPFAREERVSAA